MVHTISALLFNSPPASRAKVMVSMKKRDESPMFKANAFRKNMKETIAQRPRVCDNQSNTGYAVNYHIINWWSGILIHEGLKCIKNAAAGLQTGISSEGRLAYRLESFGQRSTRSKDASLCDTQA